jgi:Domain of unknown function (DUF6891)
MASPLSPDVEEHLATLVRGGYLTADEIVEAVTEAMEDEKIDTKGIPLTALVRERMAERCREVDSRPSAYARLQRAFEQLEQGGVLARENYWCCQTCAYSAIDQEIAEASERGEEPRGYVLFHNQDTDRAVETGSLMLRYGGVTEDPKSQGVAATKKIGDEIVALLRSLDFQPEWSGSPDDVITLPIEWDKRPPEERAARGGRELHS